MYDTLHCLNLMLNVTFDKLERLIAKSTMSTFATLKDRFDRALFIATAYMHDLKKREFLSDLIKVIATFYNRWDIWCSDYLGINMRILKDSNDTKLLKTAQQSHECAFGTEVITYGKFTWTIRINKFNYPYDGWWHIYTGVINADIADKNSFKDDHPKRAGCYSFDITLAETVQCWK